MLKQINASRSLTELPIVFVHSKRETMEEIPEFILRGVDVLNELLILLHHPLNFQFSPEFLRRIKMNEDSIEDREQVSIYLFLTFYKFNNIEAPRYCLDIHLQVSTNQCCSYENQILF